MELFERPQSDSNAILVQCNFTNLQYDDDADFSELVELAKSAGAEIKAEVKLSRAVPSAKYFIGAGKAEEIAGLVKANDAGLVLFNHTLTPSQERNLEQLLQCRVLDRTGLILDIFAQRAQTFEGKLQVELAQLRYMSTRLIRGWSHLERQKGGIGLRGPGETQLELDRRLLSGRVKTIEKRLTKVRKQRSLARNARSKAAVPTVALVGYTNAGKSTLFNALASEDIYAADQLFATLDPTMRQVSFSGFGKVVLADTVGFIRHLPHGLVESFRATLEEVSNADLLLHVIDAASDERELLQAQVLEVLAEIGADKIPVVNVYNKIDLLPQVEPHLDFNAEKKLRSAWVSAQENLGLDILQKALADWLTPSMFRGTLALDLNMGRLRAKLYQHSAVQNEEVLEEGGWRLKVSMPRFELERLCRDAGLGNSCKLKDRGEG